MPSTRRIVERAHHLIVGPRLHYRYRFRRIHGRDPILDPPIEPFDKIAYLVLRSDLSSINHLADKHLVRDFVQAPGGRVVPRADAGGVRPFRPDRPREPPEVVRDQVHARMSLQQAA